MILRKGLTFALYGVICLFLGGLFLPEALRIPVFNATKSDWNAQTFWYAPWGASGVHKGIDIFGKKGTDVLAPTYGIVIFSGNIALGGRVVAVLGPKWRVHYMAHLDTIAVKPYHWVEAGERIGTLGDSGNAAGKPPHVHYSIATLVPYPWRFSSAPQGWKQMFFLNPHEKLRGL